MNFSNVTETPDSFFIDNNRRIVTVVAIVAQLIIAISAIGGNSFIVAVHCKYKHLQDSTSTFIINLGFTDLLTGFALIFGIALEHGGLRQHNYFVCLGSAAFIQYLSLVSNCIILVAIFERYIGICRREIYNRILTKRVRFWLIFCAWSLPFAVALLPLLGFNNWEDKGCIHPQVNQKWTLILRTTIRVLLTVVSMVFYVKVFKKARELQSKVRPGPMQGMNPSTTRFNTMRKSIKNGRIIALVTIVFFVSWLPYHTSIIIYCIGDILTNEALEYSFRLLALANSIMNPFLYAWQKRSIRKKLKGIIKCNKREAALNDLSPETTRVRVPRGTARTESFELKSRSTDRACVQLSTIPEDHNIVTLKSYSIVQENQDAVHAPIQSKTEDGQISSMPEVS